MMLAVAANLFVAAVATASPVGAGATEVHSFEAAETTSRRAELQVPAPLSVVTVSSGQLPAAADRSGPSIAAQMIPTPGAVGLMSLGGLAVLRRKRT